MDSVADKSETLETSSSDRGPRASNKNRKLVWLLTAVGAVVGVFIIGSARNSGVIDASDRRQVIVEQVVTIDPDKNWHPGDDVAGIRPGQPMDEAVRLFRSAYWGSPYEKGTIVVSGDISSQRYVEELWDINDGRESQSIAYVDLSSPASGNVVLSTMQHHTYNGLSGYPNVSEVEGALIKKYGPPTSRVEWSVMDTYTLVWIRGKATCAGCKFSTYSGPPRGDAAKLAELGYPLAPVITAEVERRPSNNEKVGQLTLRMTDFGMIAKAAEAEAAAMAKAQAEFDKLRGPETRF
jgi:hypothetical protein